MKRFITAASFALIALPAYAEPPYDQSLVDRALPNIPEKIFHPEGTVQIAEAASVSSTRSDIEISEAKSANGSSGSSLATGPWASDYHFIAPAQ